MATLDDVTGNLGVHYDEWKAQEKEKNKYKDEFFRMATSECGHDLAEKLAQWHLTCEEDEARKQILKYNAGWRIADIRPKFFEIGDEHIPGWEAVIEEDPALKPFEYVNRDTNRVFKRQISAGPLLLDDERLAVEKPALLGQVSFVLPWGERVLQSIDTLPPNITALVEPYLYRGKPKVSLAAPRKAKPEDLE